MAERQTAQTFGRLRNETRLLKADLLITQRRYPEAIGPLVNIVLAEPTTATGQAAYDRLQKMGFSPVPATASLTNLSVSAKKVVDPSAGKAQPLPASDPKSLPWPKSPPW